jgi:hypothetical protein
MRDRRDVVIAAMAAALLFAAGLLVGRAGESVLPSASAQDSPSGVGGTNRANPGSGITITQDPLAALKSRVTTTGPTASDSNSNNRFVAVTTPIGSGESVLFLLDSEKEQITIYQFDRNKGLRFIAARKIDYDLKINGYEDRSRYTRNDLKQQFEKQIAREAAKAVKNSGN